MVIENFVGKRRGLKIYDSKETVSNILCGVGHLCFDSFFRIGIFALYSYFYDFRLFNIDSSVTSIALLLILIDFTYYWFHRLSHQSNIFWIIHRVHHQSEHYNYSVGLRQAWFHKLTAFWIYIPPAFLGFSAKDYIAVASIHAISQIWTHTNMYSLKNSFLKYIIVTPSHHHLHHATNKPYINKNFSGIFSIWDYLFQSNVGEISGIKTTYGVNDLDCTLNVIDSNWTPLKNLYIDVKKLPSLNDRLSLVFKAPGTFKPKEKDELRFNLYSHRRT